MTKNTINKNYRLYLCGGLFISLHFYTNTNYKRLKIKKMTKNNYAPSYEDLEILEECYDKTRLMISYNRLDIRLTLNKYEKEREKEILYGLKKDLQKVIKSLHYKHMENEFNK